MTTRELISEKTRIYLPIGLALAVCLSLFFGGWNLANLNNSINTRLDKIESRLNETDSALVVRMKLFCSELERLNHQVRCPEVENIFK